MTDTAQFLFSTAATLFSAAVLLFVVGLFISAVAGLCERFRTVTHTNPHMPAHEPQESRINPPAEPPPTVDFRAGEPESSSHVTARFQPGPPYDLPPLE